jgi:hypothetical protein
MPQLPLREKLREINIDLFLLRINSYPFLGFLGMTKPDFVNGNKISIQLRYCMKINSWFTSSPSSLFFAVLPLLLTVLIRLTMLH